MIIKRKQWVGLSNVTRKPQMMESDQTNKQQTLDPLLTYIRKGGFVRAKLSTRHSFQEPCLQSCVCVQLTRSKGYSCFPGRLNNSRGEREEKRRGGTTRGKRGTPLATRSAATRRQSRWLTLRETANNNLLEITDNRTRRPRPIMNQGKHSANYRFHPSPFSDPC